MVSGRVSLPQSFSPAPFSSPVQPVSVSTRGSERARETPDFESHFAPVKQELRGGSRSNATGRERDATPAANDRTEPEARTESDVRSEGTSHEPADDHAATRLDDDGASATKLEEETGSSTTSKDAVSDGGGSEQDQSSEDSSSAVDGEPAKGADAEVKIEQGGSAPAADNPASGAVARANDTGDVVMPVEAQAAAAQRGDAGNQASVSGQSKESRADAASDVAVQSDLDASAKKKESEAVQANQQVAPATKKQGQAESSQSESRTASIDDGAERQQATGGTAGGDEEDADEDHDLQDRQRHELPGRSETTAKSETTNSGSRIDANPEASAASQDDRVAARHAESRVDTPPRADAENTPVRGDAAPAEVASGAAKLSGPSVAERLAQGSSVDTTRSAFLARGEADGQTHQTVVRGMNAVLRQGGGALTMKLSPASLGEVRIEMSMQAGRVSVQFDVGSVAAYEAIKGQIGELRQSLEQRGMTVERVETHVSPALARSSQAEGQSNQRGHEQSGQHANQDRQDAADGQSRGRMDGGQRESGGSAWDADGGEGVDADFEQSLRLGLDAVA